MLATKPRGRSRAQSARRAPAKKQRAKKRPAQWRAHGPDALGLAVLFLTVLGALSLAGSAGPVGRGIDWALRATFGATAYLVPAGALLISLAAFVRREEAGRMLVGTSLVTAGCSGIVHLVTGPAPLRGGYEGLATGGGALGALLAAPLAAFVGNWAGVLACLLIGVLGVLITTKTPFKRAAEAAWRASAIALRSFLRGVVKLSILAWTAVRTAWRNHRHAQGAIIEPDDLIGDEHEDESEEAPVLRLVPPPPDEDTTASIPAVDSREITQPALDLPLPTVTPIKRQSRYTLPPVATLRKSNGIRPNGRGAHEVSQVLERTLDEFGVDARVTTFTRGPTVTRYEIELGAGVKVQRVLSLADDISYALGSPEVRIIAPIPGKSAIGIEVPNRDRDLVTVGDVVSSPAWKRSTHPLTCALGTDIAGHPVVVNLAEMPHVLIAGSTGAGKSSCLNALICSLLMKAKPEEVRLILIDPKMVELSHFDNLPHLLAPVVTHPKRAAETLNWVVREMERRYQELALVGQRNLDLYNAAVRAGTLPPTTRDGSPREVLPYIAVFVDELADLMMVAARQVEDSICRIAQMARAVGIHLVVATQRPSVDVVTGLIKANIPSRVAFAVASQSDSRVILDMGGAEKLVGHGDMLYLPTGTSKPRRVQGAYVSEAELEALTSHIRAQQEAAYAEEVLEAATKADDDDDPDGDDDPLTEEAMELVIRMGLGSTSMLQRRLKVGFSRAGRIMDILERKGVVGPPEGSKARAVLITVEQFEEMRVRERAAQLTEH